MKASKLIQSILPLLVLPALVLALVLVQPAGQVYAQEGGEQVVPAVVTPTLESLQQEIEALKIQNAEQQKTINYLTLKLGELIGILVEKGIMPVEQEVEPNTCPQKAYFHVYTDTVKSISTADPHCAPYELLTDTLNITVDGVRHAFPIHYDLQPLFNPLNTYEANFIFMDGDHTAVWRGQIKWDDSRHLVFESESGTRLISQITYGVFAPLTNGVWHEIANQVWKDANMVGQPFKQ